MTDVENEIEKLQGTAKKGFDLGERLRNRGLRKASVTLYLDEELGVELGAVVPILNDFKQQVGTERIGVIGRIDEMQAARADVITAHEELTAANAVLDTPKRVPKLDTAELDKTLAELEEKRKELVEKLESTGLVVKMRAVPPVIQKDCRRKAKATIGVTEKKVPEDKNEEFETAYTAHLMHVILQSVTDKQTGETNTELSYEDCIDLIDYLPPGQWARLEDVITRVQFNDAISQAIESQEDFS